MREDIKKLIEEAEREIDSKIIERDRNYYKNRNNEENKKVVDEELPLKVESLDGYKLAKDEGGLELDQMKESNQDEPEMN